MAFISYKILWESEFANFVSSKDKIQDIMINQLKVEVIDTYKKMKKYQPALNLLMKQM